MKNHWKTWFVILALPVAFGGCAADELPLPEGCPPGTATYELNIRAIIEESCAYAGCHDGQSPGVPGNFRTYEQLLPYLEDGTVRSRVLDLRDDAVLGMPPSQAAYPQSQKEELTTAELELMRCWISNGFPQR